MIDSTVYANGDRVRAYINKPGGDRPKRKTLVYMRLYGAGIEQMMTFCKVREVLNKPGSYSGNITGGAS